MKEDTSTFYNTLISRLHIFIEGHMTRSCDTYLIRLQWDDGAESEDEWMNVFHVEIVGGDCVRHRICRHHLNKQCEYQQCHLLDSYYKKH